MKFFRLSKWKENLRAIKNLTTIQSTSLQLLSMRRTILRWKLWTPICRCNCKRSSNTTLTWPPVLPSLTAKFKLVRTFISLISATNLIANKQCLPTIRTYSCRMEWLFTRQRLCIQIILELAYLMCLTWSSSLTCEPKTQLKDFTKIILAINIWNIRVSKKMMLSLKHLITYTNKWKLIIFHSNRRKISIICKEKILIPLLKV